MVRVVRRRWRWFVVPLVLALVGAVLTALLTPPTYRSDSSVFFSLQSGSTASDLVQGSTYAQGQVASFAALATTPAVLQPVIDELDLDVTPQQLALQVVADAPVDTVLVDVSVLASTAVGAQETTDAVARQLVATVERLAPRNAEGDTTVQASIVTPASVQPTPVTPDLRVDLLVGLLAGLVLGLAAALARDVLDNRVRDAEVLASTTTLPLLGSLADDPGSGADSARRVVVEVAPHDPRSEFFRQMSTNLQFLGVPGDETEGGRRLQVLLITSALPGEGKSTVAVNLAAALAETEGDVLLIDADMRRPSQAEVLGIEGGVGLNTVLLGRVDLPDVVQDWGRSGLHVLPAGAIPPNPGELLASAAMRQLVETARRDYSYVVIDSPPLLPVADAAILSKVVDGVVVVASTVKLRRPQLREAIRSLEQVNARVLGIALNRVVRDVEAYSYTVLDRPGPATEQPPSVPDRRTGPVAQATPAPPPQPPADGVVGPPSEPGAPSHPGPGREQAPGPTSADQPDRCSPPAPTAGSVERTPDAYAHLERRKGSDRRTSSRRGASRRRGGR